MVIMAKVRISLKISGQDFDVNKEFVELEQSVLNSQAEAKSGITRILTKGPHQKKKLADLRTLSQLGGGRGPAKP